jgi:hypothetical protein
LGKSLKIFGSFDLDLGTGAAVDTTGNGGGMAGMFRLLMPGRVVGTELKS